MDDGLLASSLTILLGCKIADWPNPSDISSHWKIHRKLKRRYCSKYFVISGFLLCKVWLAAVKCILVPLVFFERRPWTLKSSAYGTIPWVIFRPCTCLFCQRCFRRYKVTLRETWSCLGQLLHILAPRNLPALGLESPCQINFDRLGSDERFTLICKWNMNIPRASVLLT
jgi:hypothetical protein